jgi:hypothetical protein
VLITRQRGTVEQQLIYCLGERVIGVSEHPSSLRNYCIKGEEIPIATFVDVHPVTLRRDQIEGIRRTWSSGYNGTVIGQRDKRIAATSASTDLCSGCLFGNSALYYGEQVGSANSGNCRKSSHKR